MGRNIEDYDPQKLTLFSKEDIVGILENLKIEIGKLPSSWKDEYAVSRWGVVAIIEDNIDDLTT